MPMILLPVLASAMVLPSPAENFVPTDRLQGQDMLDMEFMIAPDGTVLDCQIVNVELSERGVERACGDSVGKNIGSPLGPDGEPAYALLGLTQVAVREGASPPPVPSDLEVFVTELPGDRSSAQISLMVYVDESGIVRNCQQFPGQNEAYSRAGCNQLAGYRMQPLTNPEGDAVGYITSVIIEFIVE